MTLGSEMSEVGFMPVSLLCVGGSNSLYDEAMPHRVLRHHARLDELEQVVRPACLGPDPGAAVAAERLAPDHRAGDVAVDVEVADGHAPRNLGDRPRSEEHTS